MDRQQELRRFHASGALNGSKDNPSMSTKHSAVTGPDITSETVQGTRTTPCCERQEGNFLSGQAGKSKKGKGRGDRVDGGDENKVAKEKEAQQVLTEQLEELVGALKASSMLVHTSLRAQNKVGLTTTRASWIWRLRQRCASPVGSVVLFIKKLRVYKSRKTNTLKQVLDKTEDAAQRNLDSLQVELKKTEEQLKRSWSNSLTSCFMIAIILSIFMGTLLFMRFFPKRRWILW